MPKLLQKTIHGLKWNISTQTLNQVIRLIIWICLARILSPSDFGRLSMITVVLNFVALFSDAGFGAAIIQRENVEDNHLSSAFWLNTAVGIILASTVALAAPLLSAFYREPSLTDMTRMIAVTFLLAPIGLVHKSVLVRNMNFRLIGLIEISSAILSGITGITLALSGWGTWSLVYQGLTSSALCTCGYIIMAKWSPKLNVNRQALSDLVRFSLNLQGFNMVNYFCRNIDKLLIGRILGEAALGIYSRAHTLMLTPQALLGSAIDQVAWPSLSRIQNDIPRVRQAYLKGLGSICLLLIPIMAGMAVTANNFVLVVFGPKWTGVTPILSILCVAGCLQIPISTTGWLFLSQGRSDIQLRWSLFVAVLLAAFIGFAVPTGDLRIIAAAYTMAGAVIIFYPAFMIANRLVNLRFIEILKAISGPFTCSAVMALFTWSLNRTLTGYLSPLSILIIQVISGAGIYFGLAHLFKLKAYMNTMENIRKLLQKDK